MSHTNISYSSLPLQALELVMGWLKQLRKEVNTSLADNIPPALTSDIWTYAANDSCLACTMHMLTKEFMLQIFSMGSLPLYDMIQD